MHRLPVIVGRAGEATSPDYYTVAGERATHLASRANRKLYMLIDTAGRFVVDDRPGELRHLVMAFDHSCDPDKIADELIISLNERGLDTGYFCGRPKKGASR